MDILIVEFLTGKEEGSSIAAIRTAVTGSMGFDYKKTEEFLDELVDKLVLRCFSSDGVLKYAIAQTLPQRERIMEDTHIKNLAQAVVQAGELLRQKSLESLIAQAALTNAQIALAVELCDGNLEPLVERRHVAIVFDDSALDCVWGGIDGYNLTLIPRL